MSQTKEKCDSCRLRYVCEEQAEFICKQRNYCDYNPDPRVTEKSQARRKYKKGKLITSLDDLSQQEFIFVLHKVYHTGWFGSWQLRRCKDLIQAGKIYSAVRIDKESDHGEIY